MYEVVNIVLSLLFSATSGMIFVVHPLPESKGNGHEDSARGDEKVVENYYGDNSNAFSFGKSINDNDLHNLFYTSKRFNILLINLY